MKTVLHKVILLALLAAAAIGCKIDNIDYFVPEVVIAEVATGPAQFGPAGGNGSITVEANCDWTIFCAADWVELSATEGNKNATITYTLTTTKLPRTAVITLYSNEVESRTSELIISQTGVTEISSVDPAVASNLVTATGTTATLSGSYVALGIGEADVITAGFTLTPAGGSPFELPAAVDPVTNTFKADAAGLIPGNAYTCVAWAKLNSEASVKAASISFTPVLIPTEITHVDKATAMGMKSDDGTTGSLKASFTVVSLRQTDVITAGFTLTPAGGSPFDVAATVDLDQSTFRADLTGLVPGTAYTCVAWAKLNSEPAVTATPMTFTPAVSVPVTIVADFTSNTLWGLPTKGAQAKQEAVTKTDGNGYTWTIYGGGIEGASLWLASVGKLGFNGYVQTQALTGITVTGINFPNDGSGASGSARITIWVSTDGGESFTAVPGCAGQKPGAFTLTDQPEGAIYKIENVDVGGTNGYTKTTKLTITGIK